MSMCQKQNNPPYFELTASPLSAEILWVSELLPGLLETREAVQLHLELASGPQPVSDTVMTSHMTQQASSLLTWLAAHWCPLPPAQSWFCHLSQISHPWVPWQFDTITTLFLHLPLWKRKPTSKETFVWNAIKLTLCAMFVWHLYLKESSCFFKDSSAAISSP